MANSSGGRCVCVCMCECVRVWGVVVECPGYFQAGISFGTEAPHLLSLCFHPLCTRLPAPSSEAWGHIVRAW